MKNQIDKKIQDSGCEDCDSEPNFLVRFHLCYLIDDIRSFLKSEGEAGRLEYPDPQLAPRISYEEKFLNDLKKYVFMKYNLTEEDLADDLKSFEVLKSLINDKASMETLLDKLGEAGL